MQKFIIAAALILAAATTKAEVISRDTVAYTGEYRLEKIEKVNDYGEVSVRYVAYLSDIVNSKGEPRKFTISKATYESGKVDAVIYNNNADGSRKISKAVNTTTTNTNTAVMSTYQKIMEQRMAEWESLLQPLDIVSDSTERE